MLLRDVAVADIGAVLTTDESIPACAFAADCTLIEIKHNLYHTSRAQNPPFFPFLLGRDLYPEFAEFD